jgi:hypothetical protein
LNLVNLEFSRVVRDDDRISEIGLFTVLQGRLKAGANDWVSPARRGLCRCAAVLCHQATRTHMNSLADLTTPTSRFIVATQFPFNMMSISFSSASRLLVRRATSAGDDMPDRIDFEFPDLSVTAWLSLAVTVLVFFLFTAIVSLS